MNKPLRQLAAGAVFFLCCFLLGCGTLEVRTPARCPVHDFALERQLVPVRAGSPRHEYLRAREQDFPYPGTVFSGSHNPGQPESMTDQPICPDCRNAERQWVRENRW